MGKGIRMEKRKLRKLPFIQAKEEDIELAERGGTLEWIIRAEYVREIPGCLAVYLYCREDLLTGNRTARFCIFLEYGDYISQKSNGGWSKAALENLVYPSKKENCISADAETEKRICRWMGNPAGKNAAEAISFFQEKVREVRLATVYKGNIIKNLIMDCQSYTKYRPNETTGGIFVSWRRKEELPTGA